MKKSELKQLIEEVINELDQITKQKAKYFATQKYGKKLKLVYPNIYSVKDSPTIEWLEEMNIKNYKINPDGTVDVNGDVDISQKQLTEIPIQFGKISGNFYCYNNNLTTLKGAPIYVGGDFTCSYNKLTSLKGAPEYVGGHFYCYNNNLTSLDGAPKYIEGDFYCNKNKLTSLEGAPKKVGGIFSCSGNNLTSLEGAPTYVGKHFNCSRNELTSLEGAPKKVGGNFDCTLNNLDYDYNEDEIRKMIKVKGDIHI